jgi:hypothetical protein
MVTITGEPITTITLPSRITTDFSRSAILTNIILTARLAETSSLGSTSHSHSSTGRATTIPASITTRPFGIGFRRGRIIPSNISARSALGGTPVEKNAAGVLREPFLEEVGVGAIRAMVQSRSP